MGLENEQVMENKALEELIEEERLNGLIGKNLHVVDQWSNLLWVGPAVIGGYHINEAGDTLTINLKCTPKEEEG